MPPGKERRRAPEAHTSPKKPPLYITAERTLSPFRVAGRTMADDDYRGILERADRHFASGERNQPQESEVRRRLFALLFGLFEIGSGDVPVIDEGLANLHPSRRRKVIRRAQAIVESTAHPNLRECTPEEKEAFFDRTKATPCPNLDDQGLCMMYEHRPMVCRTFGLPLREGRKYIGDICELNFTESSTKERMDAAWDLRWEDVLGVEDEYTIPEVIVLVARMRGRWTP